MTGNKAPQIGASFLPSQFNIQQAASLKYKHHIVAVKGKLSILQVIGVLIVVQIQLNKGRNGRTQFSIKHAS